jgi:putative glutamine amidotransferase
MVERRAPLVAVTTTSVPGGPYRRPQVALYSNYVEALERVGLPAVLLTPAHTPGSLEVLLERCAGLVLTGGEDVEPARYGEAASPHLGAVNPERDAMEFHALDVATALELPVFGICRGCQLLNVFHGGTLYQDLMTELPSELRHEQLEDWGHRTHHVRLRPESQLEDALGTRELFINSYHHQAVKKLGDGLQIVALAEDDVVEGIESLRAPWVLGVQWHPERYEAASPDAEPDRRLLLSFADAVRARAGIS